MTTAGMIVLFPRHICHTEDRVRAMRHQAGTRSTNWREIGRRLAKRDGEFIVWRCDDTMVVYTRDSETGKITQRSFKPNTWRFA